MVVPFLTQTLQGTALARGFALLTVATLALGTGEAQAQYKAPGSDDPFPSNSADPSKPNVGGGGFDPMSLIHNANLSRSRNGADFAEDSQRTLNQAADEFRRLQQQRLQEMGNPASAPNSVNPSAPVTP